MDEKKYEAGRVEISSAEYRELVIDAVTNEKAAHDARSEKWKAESERDEVKKELEHARTKIAELERMLSHLQGVSSTNTYPYNIPCDGTNPWLNPIVYCGNAPTANYTKEEN